MQRSCALVFGLLAASFAAAQPTAEQTGWVKREAVPLKTVLAEQGFDDLQALKPMIGDARVIGLGEATHGTREHFQLKHRLVEFLVTEMGFTIFSIEANMPESYRLNEYVLEGKGDPARLIKGMYFWTWNTEEVLEMVKWMRRFNEQQAAAGKPQRVQFTGYDMQTPDVAMKIVTEFVAGADPAYSDELEAAWKLAGSIEQGAGSGAYGVTSAAVPVEPLRGKKLTMSGWIKSEDIENGWAGLWARVNSKDAILFMDNMMDRGAKGTTDWTRYELVIDVAADAEFLQIGTVVLGTGTAWFDAIKLELDGKPYEVAGLEDLSFEGLEMTSQQRGFVREKADPGRGVYDIRHDAGAAHDGKQSLRVSRPRAGDPVKALEATRGVVTHLSAGRERFAAAGRGAGEIEWAIQNARVVAQCTETRSDFSRGFGVRDRSMAENIGWILEQNPGAKVVLWAHNGHIARGDRLMGGHLGRSLGKDYVPVGFATATGRYTALSAGGGRGGLKDHALVAPPPDSVEAVCVSTGIPILALDLRRSEADSAGSGWARGMMKMRSIGALEQDSQFFECIPADQFDLLMFTETTTPAVQLPKLPPVEER